MEYGDDGPGKGEDQSGAVHDNCDEVLTRHVEWNLFQDSHDNCSGANSLKQLDGNQLSVMEIDLTMMTLSRPGILMRERCRKKFVWMD